MKSGAVGGPDATRTLPGGLTTHIERSLGWVGNKGKFYTDSQRKEVLDLFKQGQAVYRAML